MLMERASEERRHHFEAAGKKSKKARKRKAHLDAENENAENSNEVPNFNKAVPTITGSDEAQPMPTLKKKQKKGKVLEDIEQQVQGSIRKTEDNEQQKGLKRKKRVKFNLESSNMSSDQEKREPVEEEAHEDPMLAQVNNEDKELNKPSDTTWVQKASWKSLVGETGRVSFSLGSIVGHNSGVLPGDNNVLATSMAPAKPSIDGQSINAVSAWIEGSSSAPLFERSSPSNGHSSSSHVKNTPKLVKKFKSSSESEILNHQSVSTDVVENGLKRDSQKVESTERVLDPKQAVQNEHPNVVEKVCRFMRSDNYEQEWLEAKRAVKDIFKRSRKDALKSMKMFHKKHNH